MVTTSVTMVTSSVTMVTSSVTMVTSSVAMVTIIWRLLYQVVCQEKEGDDAYAKFVADIIEILYATEEGFGPAEDGGVEGELEGEPGIDDEEAEEQEEY